MTLEECIQAGVQNNPSLEAARFDIDMAEADRKSARADFMPSLKTDYTKSRIGNISTRKVLSPDQDTLDQSIQNFNLRLSQILYSGSRIFNTYERAKIRKSVLTADMHLKQLELEYQTLTDDYDTGVFPRGNGHQVQIGISRSLQRDMTACIYAPKDDKGAYPGQTDKVAEFHKVGEWNHLKVIVTGKRIQTILNGEPFVDYEGITINESFFIDKKEKE